MTISLSGLRLTMSDIAQVQDVDRSTVTRWRRLPGAPEPIPGDIGDRQEELFDAQHVYDWLAATGRHAADDRFTRLHLAALAREIVLRLPPDQRLDVPLDLFELRARSRARLIDLGPSDGLPTAQAWLGPHLDALDEHDVLETLLGLRTVLQIPWLENEPTRPEVLRLLAGLVAPVAGTLVVHDPAAGAGDLLLETLATQSRSSTTLLVEAHETHPARLRLLTRRLYALADRLAGRSDGLATVQLRALALAPRALRNPVGLLVALLPADLSTADTIDRLTGLLNKVEPDGHIVVLGSRKALVGDLADEPSTARRRSALLRANALEVIVHLPRSVRQGPTGGASAALVLRRSAVHTRTISVDLSTVRLDDEMVDRALAEVHDTNPHLPRTLTASIDQDDLLASNLRLATSPNDTHEASPAHLLAALTIFADLQSAAAKLPLLAAASGARALPRLPIAELRAGSAPLLEILAGAKAKGDVVLTHPGDVVVSGDPFNIRADLLGGTLVEHPEQIIRITEHGYGAWTPRVLAALLPWRTAQGPTSLDAISIPVPDPEALADWDRALAAIDELQGLLRTRLDILGQLQHQLIGGLFGGSSAPTSHSTSDDGDRPLESRTVGYELDDVTLRRLPWDR